MGTRSLTYVFDDDGVPVVCIYRQFDGYPEEGGHGAELVGLLSGELSSGFNGVDELAALLVTKLKEKHWNGNIYLAPPSWPPTDAFQEYEYFVALSFPDGQPMACYRRVYDSERGEYGELERLCGPSDAVVQIGALIAGADLGDVRGASPPDPESPIAVLEALKNAGATIVQAIRIAACRTVENPDESAFAWDVCNVLVQIAQIARHGDDGLRELTMATKAIPVIPAGYRDRYSE